MYFSKTPRLARLLFPNAIWSSRDDEKLQLTFDDGPHPESTPCILACLKKQNIKATFFCLASQAEKHPDLIQDILSDGHNLGYHGYEHLNGWRTKASTYIADLSKSMDSFSSQLFRPPYGRITRTQYVHIKKELDLDIVFWTHMPGDFDSNVSADILRNRILKAGKKGNIIVLHDQPKCLSKICYALSNFNNSMA